MSAPRLRELFRQPGIIRLAAAHNALGAKLVERAGFEAVWSGGLEISTSFAVPDANILTMSEYLAAAQWMAEAVDIPIVADCDTGYGNSNNVIQLVRKFEAAGVAAVCIEDKQFPKVNSFVPGRQELAPVAEFVGKIMAAKNAQRTPEFMVIARVEALIAGWPMDEALRRAHAYVQAGADAILIHSSSPSPRQIADFAAAWDGSAPLVVVPTTYFEVTASELERMGVKMVIYANHGLRASVAAIERVYADILSTGSTAAVEDRIAPLSQIFQLQGMPQMKVAEAAYLRTADDHTRAIIPAAGDHLAEPSMQHIAAEVPIAMLDVNGSPLLQRQLDVLRRCRISDVSVIAGYKHQLIEAPGAALFCNPDWQTSGELQSIMCAPHDFAGRTLIAYADILFDAGALKRLLASEADVTLVVDRTFDAKSYAGDRRIDLVATSKAAGGGRRSLEHGSPTSVLRIGKGLPPDSASGEFAGLALFSAEGFRRLRQVFEELAAAPAAPFHEAPSGRRAAVTDALQELIDSGQPVSCVEVSSGWMEIRSFDDYRLACELVAR